MTVTDGWAVRTIVRVWWSSVLLLSAVPVRAQTPAEVVGPWRLVTFSIPSHLTVEQNTNGLLTGIPEAMWFNRSMGRLVVGADGFVAGTTPDPFLGAYELGGPGEVIIRPLSPRSSTPIVFQANAALDVMASVGSSTGLSQDLILSVREPSALIPGELAGAWNMTGFRSPTQLFLRKNPAGQVTGIDGLGQFGTYAGTMTIRADGSITGSMGGPFTGAYRGYAEGVLTVEIVTPGGAVTRTLFPNASKDTMLMLATGQDEFGSYQEFMVFQRAPAPVTIPALAASWSMHTYDLPRLAVQMNAQGLVTGLSGLEGFGALRMRMVSGYDGFFTVPGSGGVHGTIAMTGPGTLTANVQLPEGQNVVPLRVNAGLNVLSAITETNPGFEFMFMVRSPNSSSASRDFGMLVSRSPAASEGVLVEWAAGTNSVLQTSPDLVQWQSVGSTVGKHEYRDPATNRAPAFFRVMQPGP